MQKDFDIIWLVKSIKQVKSFLKLKAMTDIDRLISKNTDPFCIYVDGEKEEDQYGCKDIFNQKQSFINSQYS
jgi:hypothetical protein